MPSQFQTISTYVALLLCDCCIHRISSQFNFISISHTQRDERNCSIATCRSFSHFLSSSIIKMLMYIAIFILIFIYRFRLCARYEDAQNELWCELVKRVSRTGCKLGMQDESVDWFYFVIYLRKRLWFKCTLYDM